MALTLYNNASGIELESSTFFIQNDAITSIPFEVNLSSITGLASSGQTVTQFPHSEIIEQIYYPSANPAVSVELFGDAQFNMTEMVSLNTQLQFYQLQHCCLCIS